MVSMVFSQGSIGRGFFVQNTIQSMAAGVRAMLAIRLGLRGFGTRTKPACRRLMNHSVYKAGMSVRLLALIIMWRHPRDLYFWWQLVVLAGFPTLFYTKTIRRILEKFHVNLYYIVVKLLRISKFFVVNFVEKRENEDRKRIYYIIKNLPIMESNGLCGRI